MKLYVVPENEIYRFASSLKRQVLHTVESPFFDAVVCIEQLTESKLKFIKDYCCIRHVSRDIVINHFAGPASDLSEIELIDLAGSYEYVRYWVNL